MTSLHDGHLTQSPSGTRLSLFAWGSIGFRTFLNHAIFRSLSERFCPPRPATCLLPPALPPATCPLLSGARHVVARPLAHPVQLLHQVVERVVAPGQVELRCFDHEQRRGVVVEEEMVVG